MISPNGIRPLRLLWGYPFLASLPRYDDSSTTKSTLPPLLFDSFPNDDDEDDDPDGPSTRNFPTADPCASYATRTSPTFAISRPLLPGGMACESCTCSPVSGWTRNIRTLRGGLRGSALRKVATTPPRPRRRRPLPSPPTTPRWTDPRAALAPPAASGATAASSTGSSLAARSLPQMLSR